MIISVCDFGVNMLVAFIAIVLTLLIVVGLHEMGHAMAARMFSVSIQRVAIGFGKPLWSWKSQSGIEWVIGRWLLGGYVQLLNTRIQSVPPELWPVCFDKKPVWVRCIILLSGGAVNVLVAWLSLTLYFSLGYSYYRPVIESVLPHGMVAEAGFEAKDTFVAFNQKETPSWEAVCLRLIASLGQHHVLVTVMDAKGQLKDRYLDLDKPLASGKSIWQGLGFDPDVQQKVWVSGVPLLKAITEAGKTLQDLWVFFLVMVKQIVMKRVPFILLLGPIGLIDSVIESFVQGLSAFSYFIASFSLAVGVVNLFPLPGLDGGSIVYALVEKIRGKAISVALELLLYRLAVIAFWVFFIQLLGNDLLRYV